jgi:hypothetical protein
MIHNVRKPLFGAAFLFGNGLLRAGSGNKRQATPTVKALRLRSLTWKNRLRKNGASEGIRTLDVHLGKVMLYQLSYARFLEKRGAAYENPPIKQALVLLEPV